MSSVNLKQTPIKHIAKAQTVKSSFGRKIELVIIKDCDLFLESRRDNENVIIKHLFLINRPLRDH